MANPVILIEAESFDDYGGWSLDTQFMDQMGSPYLIAHGFGKPVGNASTTVKCPESGRYRVWVRTFDWVGRWRGDKWPMRKRAFGKAPGRFTVLINGKPIDGTFGTTGQNWHWRKGPVVRLMKGSFKLTLKDLTGFDGRCDAILFTQQKEIAPPNSDPEMKIWRNKLLGLSLSPRDGGEYDLVVVGGGVAGMCSALSAARLGCKVALIQDRPVLGGNTSSEVCVNISGKLGFKPYPNIGNIVKEIQPKAQRHWHTGPFETGLPEDVKRLRLIQAEKNITLFLNHRMNDVGMAGLRISSVLAENTKTGESIKFTAKLFADCTGDGCVGALAKADFAMTTYGHMGRSNLWFVHDIGTPTTFPRCPWALNLYGYDRLREAPTKIDGWYWESGYNHDPIAEGEYIRDWNLRAVYGSWDAHKNERKEYKTHEIKWLAFISGKRESRRLMGDVVLNGDDILSGKEFEDGCVPLSWRLDVHRPDPQYLAEFEGDAFIAIADLYGKEESRYKGPYWMPYRCLYSRDVPNLFMAGRNISTTQDALGAARVQRTTGMMGEVVGLAATICKENDCDPKDVYEKHLPAFKKLLTRGVNHVGVIVYEDTSAESDDVEVMADLVSPVMTEEAPAAGKRVRQVAPEYKGTEVYHSLYLPVDWKPGGKYSVIVEYTGNKWAPGKSTGEVKDANLGYGMSGGRGFIWVSMPYVEKGRKKNAVTWWGDRQATVDYCKVNLPRICKQFGGDPENVFICGFSRGAIGVSYIGLADDEIAALWKGMFTHDHFDGQKKWGYPESDRASALVRLARLKGRPVLICGTRATKVRDQYLKDHLNLALFSFLDVPTYKIFKIPEGKVIHPHTDLWMHRESKYRQQARAWLQNVVGSHSNPLEKQIPSRQK